MNLNDFYFELVIKPKKDFDKVCEFVNFIYDDAVEEGENSLIIRSEDEVFWIIRELEKNSFEFDYFLEKKANIDWIDEYKKHIKPIKIDRFYIYPSWEKPNNKLLNIILEPTIAFGSGHHETTHSCIEAISKYVNSKDRVLDVGCGSGILAICATKLGAIVDLCDTDKLAVKNAKENFELNNLEYNNIWIGSVNKTKGFYDTIIANIVADILIFLKQDFNNRLKNNGKLILSGILDKYEGKILFSFGDFKIVEKIYKNEWVTLILQKGER